MGCLSVAEVVALAAKEARMYREGGVDGIGIENMHDLPYLRGGVGPEIVAAMTLVGQAVKAESGLPVGVQVLAGANLEAMAVAHAAGLDFIRVEGYVFAHVADGFIIGTHFKMDGHWANTVDPHRVGEFMEAVRKMRVGL